MMPTRKQKALEKLSTNLFTLGVTFLFITPMLLLYTYLSQSTLTEYRRNGVIVEANVIDKWKEYGPPASIEHYIKVGFFVGSILEGGELFMPTISDFVYASTWTSLQPGDKVDVIYLPKDPENTTLLKAAIDPGNLAPIHKYKTGFVALAIGIALTGLGRIVTRLVRV